MKQRFWIMALLPTLLAAHVCGQVRIDPPYHAFKAVKPGDRLVFNAKVTNFSAYPVTFQGMKTSCSCLSSSLPSYFLGPKKTALLEVVYNAPLDGNGLQDYKVTFNVHGRGSSGEDAARKVEVPLTAEIKPDYLFEPRELDLGLVPQGEKRTFDFRLTVDTAALKGLRILKANTQVDGIEAKWRAVSPGTYKVTLSCLETLEPGDLDQYLTLTGTTTNQGEVDLRLPYKGQVRGAWRVSPSFLLLDPAHVSGRKVRMYTQVGNLWHKGFRVNGVKDLPDWLKVKTKPGPAGTVVLEWEVDGKKMAKADRAEWPEALTVATDLKDGETFRIGLESSKKSD